MLFLIGLLGRLQVLQHICLTFAFVHTHLIALSWLLSQGHGTTLWFDCCARPLKHVVLADLRLLVQSREGFLDTILSVAMIPAFFCSGGRLTNRVLILLLAQLTSLKWSIHRMLALELIGCGSPHVLLISSFEGALLRDWHRLLVLLPVNAVQVDQFETG